MEWECGEKNSMWGQVGEDARQAPVVTAGVDGALCSGTHLPTLYSETSTSR